jgi:pimeloyl-ACP methyl ester carboxylesterase
MAHSSSGHATTGDGVRIAYDVTGSDGPPVVLVHGITEHRGLWRPVVDRLATDHRCIALDLRGHGESATADLYSSIAMAGDLAAGVAACGDDEPPLLVGHSLGAMVATMYTASGAGPVRAIVNVDQRLRLGDLASTLRPLEGALRDDFAATMAAFWATMGAETLPAGTQAALEDAHAGGRQEVVLGVWGTVFSSTDEELDAIVRSAAAAVSVPYLAIHGSDPGPGYPEWLRAVLPTATVEVWDGQGHWPHLADPDRFVERVRAFSRAGDRAPGR